MDSKRTACASVHPLRTGCHYSMFVVKSVSHTGCEGRATQMVPRRLQFQPTPPGWGATANPTTGGADDVEFQSAASPAARPIMVAPQCTVTTNITTTCIP